MEEEETSKKTTATNEFKISFVERGLNRRIVHVVWFGVSLRDNGDGME
jgi:hypothetical protein